MIVPCAEYRELRIVRSREQIDQRRVVVGEDLLNDTPVKGPLRGHYHPPGEGVGRLVVRARDVSRV